MYSPPAGFEDIFTDAEQTDNLGPWATLEVEGVDSFRCRRPMPRAVAVLGNATKSKISEQSRNDYVGLFVSQHMSKKSLDKLLVGMMTGRYPVDATARVCQALAIWGTARPTVPLSISR